MGCSECHARADAPADAETEPTVRFTLAAQVEASRRVAAAGRAGLRLVVDKQHRHELFADDPRPGDSRIELDGLSLLLDRKSRSRADGVVVDFVRADGLEGFLIEDPAEPARVCELEPSLLRRWLAGGKSVWLFDVRAEVTGDEALYRTAKPLDAEGRALLEELDPDSPLVFLACHRERAWAAAGHAVGLGFRAVYACPTGPEAPA